MSEPPIGSQVEAALRECPTRTTWRRTSAGHWACECCSTTTTWRYLEDPTEADQ